MQDDEHSLSAYSAWAGTGLAYEQEQEQAGKSILLLQGFLAGWCSIPPFTNDTSPETRRK